MIRGAFPPVTTRQTLSDVIELISSEDGTSINLTGCTAKVAMISADYAPAPGWWGGPNYYDRLLRAPSIDATVTILEEAGGINFVFTTDQMRTLCPGQYRLAATVTRDDYTVQIILGDIPVLDGGVPL